LSYSISFTLRMQPYPNPYPTYQAGSSQDAWMTPTYYPAPEFQPTAPPMQNLALIHRVPCLWGGSCNILLDDVSAAGIMRHLRVYHLCDPNHPWDKKARGVCEWGGECGKEMAYASYGKHVAAVHLRSRVQCPYCYRDVGRSGLLDRHIQNYCPHAQGQDPSHV